MTVSRTYAGVGGGAPLAGHLRALAGTGAIVTLSDIRFTADYTGAESLLICDVHVVESTSHTEYSKICEHCGASFIAESPKARFCSGAHKIAYHRAVAKASSEAVQ